VERGDLNVWMAKQIEDLNELLERTFTNTNVPLTSGSSSIDPLSGEPVAAKMA
jgi:hypothetical protein